MRILPQFFLVCMKHSQVLLLFLSIREGRNQANMMLLQCEAEIYLASAGPVRASLPKPWCCVGAIKVRSYQKFALLTTGTYQ
ncbi:hypothetical protein M758_UG228000 [Ceratodon purpureus]|nr:hypothetical protein M758_UG228000 [Ceratodon purpureus]